MEFTPWNAWWIICTIALLIYVFKSYSAIYSNFSTEEAAFDWQLWEQKLFFVHKTGTARKEMREGFGPHTHSFPGLSRDLIITVINSNVFMALCHLWEEPAVLFTWSQAPPRKPRAGGRSWHKALGRGCCNTSPRCLLEPEDGEEQYVTADIGKAGKCDQKPGLQFTGKMILPVKEILFKKPKNKDIWGLLWEIRMSNLNCGFSLYNRTLHSWRDLFIWFFALSDSSRQCTQAAVQKTEIVRER